MGEGRKKRRRMEERKDWNDGKRVIVRYSTVFHPNPKRIGVSE